MSLWFASCARRTLADARIDALIVDASFIVRTFVVAQTFTPRAV